MHFLKATVSVFALGIAALEAFKSDEWQGGRRWYSDRLKMSESDSILDVEFTGDGYITSSLEDGILFFQGGQVHISYLTVDRKIEAPRHGISRENILAALAVPTTIEPRFHEYVNRALLAPGGEEIVAEMLDSAGVEFLIVAKAQEDRPLPPRAIPYTLETVGNGVMNVRSTTTVGDSRQYYANKHGYPLQSIIIQADGQNLDDAQLMWSVQGHITVRIMGARVH